jgi:hypothetical protein
MAVAEPGFVAGARATSGRVVAVVLGRCRDAVGDWARTLPLERMLLRLLTAPAWRMGLFDEGRRCADEMPFLKPLSHAPFPQEIRCTLPPLPCGPPAAPGARGRSGGPAREARPGGPKR